jgi:hypothetical protein
VRVLHRSTSAEVIVREGFRDGTAPYLTSGEYTGVWLSDRPLDLNEGAIGSSDGLPDLVEVEIPLDVLADFEWIEDMKSYREFLVPAAVVNSYPRRIVQDS